MREIARVALLIESSRAYGRQILRGVGEYMRIHGPWSVYQGERDLGDTVPAGLARWRPQGVIARVESRMLAGQLKRLGVPTVDLFGLHEMEGVPSFDDDEGAVGRLAARHLLDRGFRHLAFCGFPGLHYSENRCQAFRRHVQAAGLEVSVYGGERRAARVLSVEAEARALGDGERLGEWLRSLPKPVGVMACNDMRGQQLLRVCVDTGLRVPRDVAVIGVDNDDVQCELSQPPLSSVEPDARRMGYEAARSLAKMMAGKTVPSRRRLIAPVGVVTRGSTDVIVTSDEHAAEALRLIHEQACSGLSVEGVLKNVPVSRSTLERRFRELFGRSPKAEIQRVKLERVKELLVRSEFKLARIAEAAGYEHLETMCRVFRKATGTTPAEYRRRVRFQ